VSPQICLVNNQQCARSGDTMDGSVYLILADKSPRAPLCYFSIMYTHIPNKRQKCRSGKSMPPRERERVFVQIKGDARGKQSIILRLNLLPAHKERDGAAGRTEFVCHHQEYTLSQLLPLTPPLLLLAIDFPALWEIGSKSCRAHKEKMTHLTALKRRTR
jgi:hypothetical protein